MKGKVMRENILSNIGNTPLVSLKRVFRDIEFRLFAKLEAFNPGGSIKDRAAHCIIKSGIEMGEILPDTTVVESSSGNMGIGLAQACAYYGLRFICVVDPKTTRQNIEVLKAYGAEIDYISEPDPVTGEYLQARINRVRSILQSVTNSFWTNQYANIYNLKAHYQTMQEIVLELDGQVDYLFCATSTCGTVMGCGEYAQQQNLHTRLIAVDARGSVIFGDQPAKRLIPGHGASVRPALYRNGLVEKCIHISDRECVVGCRRLVREEAILAGGSSGAVVMAIEQMKDEIPAGATCVAIFPDRGERYLDTIYSDSWVEEHFGDISHLWQKERAGATTCVTATY
jgi:cysteine synthase A